MGRLIVFFSLLCSMPLFSYESENQAIRKATSHLIIHDPLSAALESKKALEIYPESKQLKKILIQALSDSGNEKEALKTWNTLSFDEDFQAQKHDLLESLAWGVLKKAESSSQIGMRIMALIGAFFTHDAKAVPSFIEKLRSSNSHERALAVRLSSMYRDAALKDEIHRLLKNERVWYVRLELIHAIGVMGIEELSWDLKEIIANPKSTIEEKSLAVESLLTLYDRIENDELISLVVSDRGGLRALACEIVLHLDLKKKISYLLPLLKDSSPDVRVAILNVMGLLGQDFLQENEEIFEEVMQMLDHPLAEIAITAAWAILPLNTKRALSILEKHLSSNDPEIRRLAAGALARSGKAGDALAIQTMGLTKDRFVSVNLALGLLGRRVEVQKSCESLFLFLESEKDKIMWEHGLNPIFRTVGPSQVRHVPQIPNYPSVVDQMTRLNILNLLALLRYPKSQDAIKAFLHESNWGVTGSAAITLLQEGDSETLDLIKEMLNDSDENVRLQSALAMAMLGADPEVIEVLQKLFSKVDREKKTQILEAIGHIGTEESIPFLIDVLSEPFQALRIVAASALIQCIYH